MIVIARIKMDKGDFYERRAYQEVIDLSKKHILAML